MVSVTDADLLVAGYVITAPGSAPPGESTLPAAITTISDCIMPDLPRPEWWDWFTDVDEALSAQSTCLEATQLTTVALHRADASDFMKVMGGAEQPSFDKLRQLDPVVGSVLGYEVVGAEVNLDFHSWHCHGYADAVSESLRIRVNRLGLLSTYSDASEVLRWMLGLPSSESPAPVPWVVVALCETTTTSH